MPRDSVTQGQDSWLPTCGRLWQGIDLYFLLISAVGLCLCLGMTILFMFFQLSPTLLGC
jgi:hypothetical protein